MSVIYFDNAATMPVCEAAKAEILRALGVFGNPSSPHGAGLEAERYVKAAAKDLAGVIGASFDEIIFTSGGTESNNLAVFGAVGGHRRGRVVMVASEHPSVAEPFKVLAQKGFEVVVLPASPNGVDIARLTDAVNGETILVSVCAVNNETGVMCDVEAVGRAIKQANAQTLFHSDCVQAFAKHELNVKRAKIDLLGASGHKLGAPKGVGLLYVASGVRLKPMFYGGGQQRGLRPGTENTVGIGAFAAAAKEHSLCERRDCVSEINNYIRNALADCGAVINSPANASPYILNVSFPGIKPEILMRVLEDDGIIISTGAACSTNRKKKPPQNHGLTKELAESAVRLSFSRFNTMNEAERAADGIKKALEKLSGCLMV